MFNDITAVRNKEVGLTRASKIFEVPRSTLKDKANSGEADINTLVNTRHDRKPVLPERLKDELSVYNHGVHIFFTHTGRY